MRLLGQILGLLTIIGLSACSQLPADLRAALQPSSEHSSSPEAPAKPEPTTKTTAATPPAADLRDIIQMLEEGQQTKAHAALVAYLAHDPKNAQALDLKQQLDSNPVTLLGKPTSTYTVRSGDTLSGLAERFLGDSLKFVVLARYNHIKRSKDLRVGQIIKLPARAKQIHTADKTASHESENAAESTAAESNPTPETTTTALPRLPKTRAAPSVSGPEHDQAVALQNAGLAALKHRQLEAAYTSFSRALTVEPGIEPAQTQVQTLKPKLVRQYHEQALVAYRQQNLDQAIALWDKALALDPTYEPALGYRARALELKKRLNQLSPAKP